METNKIASWHKLSIELLDDSSAIQAYIANNAMYELRKVQVGRVYRFDLKFSFGYENDDYIRNLITMVVAEKYYHKPRFIDFAKNHSISRQFYQNRRNKNFLTIKKTKHYGFRQAD